MSMIAKTELRAMPFACAAGSSPCGCRIAGIAPSPLTRRPPSQPQPHADVRAPHPHRASYGVETTPDARPCTSGPTATGSPTSSPHHHQRPKEPAMYHVHPHLAARTTSATVSTRCASPPASHAGAARYPDDNDIASAARRRSITSKEPTMHPTLACDLALLHVHARARDDCAGRRASPACGTRSDHRPPRQGRR